MSDSSGPSRSDTLAAASIDTLQQEVRQARRDREEDEIFAIIAENSGWSLDDMTERPHEITAFELFLLNIPRVPELRLFPNLVTVKLTHIGLTSMLDLQQLRSVEELWLSENFITKIEALENMTRLRRLYLQGNAITSMEGLPVLKHLRELWLCRNNIQQITGLGKMRKLRALWMASNPISSLAGVFTNHLTHLHDLNLADCHLYSFHHVAHLKSLPCLRNVWFSDPLFGDNPICRLNNYTIFTLHLLDSLDTLDHSIISNEQRALARSIYRKKRVYYSMRITTLSRNHGLLYQHALKLGKRKEDEAVEAVQRMAQFLTPLRLDLKERQAYQGRSSLIASSVPQPRLEQLEREVSRAEGTREVQMQTVQRCLARAVQTSEALKATLQQRLCVELNTGGNVRLEEITSTADSWYESSRDLLLARFTPEPFKKFGIKGVEVCRVKRVVNRGLRLRFDDRMKELEIDLTDATNRKTLVCLFSPVPTSSGDQLALVRHALIHGMEPATEESGGPKDHLPSTSEGVALTNSLFFADEERLLACQRRGELIGINANPSALTGQLIVSRVFLGKSVQALGGSGGSGNDKDAAAFISRSRRVCTKDYSSDVFSVYRIPVDEQNVRVWYGLDRSLILPEVIMEYCYKLIAPVTTAPALSLVTTQSKLPTSLQGVLDTLLPVGLTHSDWDDLRECSYPLLDFIHWCDEGRFMNFAEEETNSAILASKELLDGRVVEAAATSTDEMASPLTAASVEQYYRQVGCSKKEGGAICVLRGRGLSSVPRELETPLWGNLVQLDLSSNGLRTISWFALSRNAPRIQHLSLRGNALQRLDVNATVLPSLNYLDVSFNRLESLQSFDEMDTCFPSLRRLYANDNPCLEAKNAIFILLSYFRPCSPLQELNRIDVSGLHKISIARWRRSRSLGLSSSNTRSLALRYLVKDTSGVSAQQQNGTYVNIESLDSGMIVERLFEAPIAALTEVEFQAHPKVMAAAAAEVRDVDVEHVATLIYHHSLLHDLAWLSALSHHLQHLSLRSHNLADLTPVTSLKQLEMLDVQDNCITFLPDLSSLRRLRYLDASFNVLTSIASMGQPEELRCLNISCNALRSVEPALLAGCEQLEELYVSHNALSGVSEFYALRDLPLLMTMDVSGNPMMEGRTPSDVEEVKGYFIFNFRQLKVLNSCPISHGDAQRARDVFAGRISADLLAQRTHTSKSQWKSMTELDLSHCSLREVTLLEPFAALQILKLHHNVIVRIDGVTSLRQLRALDLSFNRLGQVNNATVGEALRQLPMLESLSLEANHITDLTALALQASQLKFLNLKANELQYLDHGLQNLPLLRELILDNNKLRGFSPACFTGCRQLIDISAEDNSIRTTEGLQRLPRLERITLGANRIPELKALLQDLQYCPLVNATFVGNVVARKSHYRVTVIGAFPHLRMLDNKIVLQEEREKAEKMRNCEYVAPPNVVIDVNYLQSLQQQSSLDGNAVGSRGAVSQQPGVPHAATKRVLNYGARGVPTRTAPRGM